MKQLMLSTAIIGALAGSAWSQTATDGPFRSEAAQGDIRASDLIGMRIYATEAPVQGDAINGTQDGWDDIGEVNDVILSLDGKVEAVLVDIGGFLGMGERQVAVQMTSLNVLRDDATGDDPDDFFLVLNANRGVLEGAPVYGDAAMTDAAADSTIAEGGISDDQPPVTAAPANGTATATTEQPAAATEGKAATSAQAGSDAMEATGTEGAITTEATDVATTTTETSPAIARDGYSTVTREALTAETLTSAPVYDSRDARIGEIADLVLNESGQVTQVVFDVGGFLGMGEKRVALPIDEVNILRQTDGSEIRVYVSETEDQLKQMPTYEG